VTYSMTIADPAFRIPEQMALVRDEVYLWRVDLAAVSTEGSRWQQLLSHDERTRASRYRSARDGQYFAATRGLLRTILASYVDSDPQRLVFQYSEKGKPFLDTSSPETRVEFNVSHSGATALLVFARERDLGVDVEEIRENFDHKAIARRFFSEHEQRQLAELDPADRYEGFFRCWTRKEAYIKAKGIGLALPLRDFDVSVLRGDHEAMLATRPDGAEAPQWSLREVPVGSGYVAAVCVAGRGWVLRS
jgi:4'-phosphopantetheinyl transferase